MAEFNANGQVLFIEPRWVTGETCLFNITNRIEYLYAQTEVTKKRKAFIKYLESIGFEITYDKNDNRDVIHFIMNESAISSDYTNISEYKKEFDRIIFLAGGEKLNYPKSLTMEEFFINPFFPVVLKNELTNGGVDKFFIKNESQLNVIKKFYNDFKNNKIMSDVLKSSIFQQYIETPTQYQTYMRVLMSASGDVMGESLNFSQGSYKKRESLGDLEKYFWNEQSPYFVDCEGMFNYYSDGDSISFSQPKYSGKKRNILASHNIDCLNPQIPDDVLEVASNIARKCNKELGIICGIDFIYNKNDNKWYYLENQAFPALDEWAKKNGKQIPKEPGVKGYLKYLDLDLEARYEALMLMMKSKQKSSNEDVKKLLKN